MVKTKFKGTVRKWTSSFVVTVPMSYINNGLMEEGKTYEFGVNEVVSDDGE